MGITKQKIILNTCKKPVYLNLYGVKIKNYNILKFTFKNLGDCYFNAAACHFPDKDG
jgi:hypothetical protein